VSKFGGSSTPVTCTRAIHHFSLSYVLYGRVRTIQFK